MFAGITENLINYTFNVCANPEHVAHALCGRADTLFGDIVDDIVRNERSYAKTDSRYYRVPSINVVDWILCAFFYLSLSFSLSLTIFA